MANVFPTMFDHHQSMDSQLHASSHGFITSHPRMLGKRQRSASPNANGDDGMRGNDPKRTKPTWTATPSPGVDTGFAQADPHVRHLNTTGFFDLTNIMPTAPTSPFGQHQPSVQNPYPFPFPSPNHLSPSGLVLPDSSMTTHSTFTADARPRHIASNASRADFAAPGYLPLEREGSHGSLADLRTRMASSGLDKDLPCVIDDSANDGDDEMAMPSGSMRTHNSQNDVAMDVPVPRPPRNSFSSFAHAPNEIGHGSGDNPFASMISDRLARTTSGENEGPDVSRRSNISDNMSIAEQYFVDGMRGIDQQHTGWSSPIDRHGNDQHLRSGGDIDMVCARLSGLPRRMTS
jgi:hypothetical protein